MCVGLQMYGLGGSFESHAELSATVRKFLDLSGALTLPRLEEFDLQQDKVKTGHGSSYSSQQGICPCTPVIVMDTYE